MIYIAFSLFFPFSVVLMWQVLTWCDRSKCVMFELNTSENEICKLWWRERCDWWEVNNAFLSVPVTKLTYVIRHWSSTKIQYESKKSCIPERAWLKKPLTIEKPHCTKLWRCKYIQWVRKVFRPPYIFHSLLYCSHLLKSFKFIFSPINVHTAPHIDRKTQNCWHFYRFIKKEKLKYHMVLSIQTLCCDTHIFNSGTVHFFWSSLRWFYTFIWVQLCLIILIGLD